MQKRTFYKDIHNIWQFGGREKQKVCDFIREQLKEFENDSSIEEVSIHIDKLEPSTGWSINDERYGKYMLSISFDSTKEF